MNAEAPGLGRLYAGWRAKYVSEVAGREEQCFLCGLARDDSPIDTSTLLLERTELTLTVMNLYPYGSGHLLVAPRAHEADLESVAEETALAIMRAQRRAIVAIKAAYRCDAVNLGMNLGRAAGAGVPDHLHAHLLPRWSGDTNFMTAIAETRVLSESLEDGWAKLHSAWPAHDE